jgi:hypothetical protein
VYFTYGGVDSAIGEDFYQLDRQGFGMYTIDSPWSYFPFSTLLFSVWDVIAELTGFSVRTSYRLSSGIVDTIIIYLVYRVHISLNQEGTPILSALLYAINPISIYVTCAMGHVDPFALAPVLLGFLVFNGGETKFRNVSNFLFSMALSLKPIVAPVVFGFLWVQRHRALNAFQIVIFTAALNVWFFCVYGWENSLLLVKSILVKSVAGVQYSNFWLGLVLREDMTPTAHKVLICVTLGLVAIGLTIARRFNVYSFGFALFGLILLSRPTFHFHYIYILLPALYFRSVPRWTHLIVFATSIFLVLVAASDPAHFGATPFGFLDTVRHFAYPNFYWVRLLGPALLCSIVIYSCFAPNRREKI